MDVGVVAREMDEVISLRAAEEGARRAHHVA
jgi:hypothetical protein